MPASQKDVGNGGWDVSHGVAAWYVSCLSLHSSSVTEDATLAVMLCSCFSWCLQTDIVKFIWKRL